MKLRTVENNNKVMIKPLKHKKQPAFGMKIYLDRKIPESIIAGLDYFPQKSKRRYIELFKEEVKNVLTKLYKDIASHNFNPKNHEVFPQEINIKDIQIKYKDSLILDSKGIKKKNLPRLSEEKAAIKLMPHSRGESDWREFLNINVLTDCDVAIEKAKSNGLFLHINIADEIQKAKIAKIEAENPNYYLDLIQPPKKSKNSDEVVEGPFKMSAKMGNAKN